MEYYIDLNELNDFLNSSKLPIIEIKEGYELDEKGEKLILTAKTITETKNISDETDNKIIAPLLLGMISTFQCGEREGDLAYSIAKKTLTELGILKTK